jgi:hypothetical protein
VRVESSTLAIAGQRVAVTGNVTNEPTGLEIVATVRDPDRGGWTAEASGHVVWAKNGDVTLEDGRIDVHVPTMAVGAATVTNARVSAEVSGNLSQRRLAVRGAVHAERTEVTRLGEITDVRVPFAFASDREDSSLRISDATARLGGGRLTLEPFVLGSDVHHLVVNARGIELERIVRELGNGHVAGGGLLDGRLVVRGDEAGWSIEGASLRARGKGALRVTDRKLRERIAAASEASSLAIVDRITAALADFEYTELQATLGPEQSLAELQISMRGQGRRVAQALAVDLRVRGVRDAIERMTR